MFVYAPFFPLAYQFPEISFSPKIGKRQKKKQKKKKKRKMQHKKDKELSRIVRIPFT